MPETLLAKLAGLLWESIKGLAVLIVGLLSYLFRRQDKVITDIQTELSTLKTRVVYKDDLDVKAKEIEARVAVEHQRIYDKVTEAVETLISNQNRSNDQLREDMITYNVSVMKQINGPVSEQIAEIRNYVFNHIERRSTERK